MRSALLALFLSGCVESYDTTDADGNTVPTCEDIAKLRDACWQNGGQWAIGVRDTAAGPELVASCIDAIVDF